MKELLVREWMHTAVVAINPELRLERAWETMERQRVRHLPVVKQERLVGIVTQRDLKRAVFGNPPTPTVWKEGKPQPTGTPGDLPVEAVMTQEVYTAKPTDTLLSAALCMRTAKISALPVVDETKKLVGILTQTDLLSALISLLQAPGERPSPCRFA